MPIQRAKAAADTLEVPIPMHPNGRGTLLSPPPRRPSTRPPELNVDTQLCDYYLLAVAQDRNQESGRELRRFIWGDDATIMESMTILVDDDAVASDEDFVSPVTGCEDGRDGERGARLTEPFPEYEDWIIFDDNVHRGRQRRASCPGALPPSRSTSAASTNFVATNSHFDADERVESAEINLGGQRRDASVSNDSSNGLAPIPWRHSGETLTASIASSWDSDSDSDSDYGSDYYSDSDVDDENDMPNLTESLSSPSPPLSEPLAAETGLQPDLFNTDLDTSLISHHLRVVTRHPLGPRAIVPRQLSTRQILFYRDDDCEVYTAAPDAPSRGRDTEAYHRELLDELPFPQEDAEMPSFEIWMATMPPPSLELAARCSWRVRHGAAGWI